MKSYRINKNTDTNPGGHNEVHSEDCTHYSVLKDYEYLGQFSSCHGAIQEARDRNYTKADGCAFCCPDCNTG